MPTMTVKKLNFSYKITPKGIRIPVCSVKGSCPRPLDDGGSLCSVISGQRDSNARHQPWQGCALPLSYARTKIKIIDFYNLADYYSSYNYILCYVYKFVNILNVFRNYSLNYNF